ncbi:uncharacterized protein LOC134837741 [Culicoides brevitarsis]|uniref:uncharacterized protein LOC134837741 n=1 Tax=Culicoides brevitarsis TaxID=469753 RepID=UPI00307C6E63
MIYVNNGHHNFFYGQAQGRFIPSGFQDTRNGFFPASVGSRNGGPGSYQDRQIFVAQNNPQQPSTAAFFPFGNYPVTTRRPDFFEINPRPFSIDDGYRQTPLTFTRGQSSLKSDYYDTGYSGNSGQTNRFRQDDDLLAGEEINVQQLPSRNRFSSRENTETTAKLNSRHSNDPYASQNQQQQRENTNVRNSNSRGSNRARGTPSTTTPVPKPVKKERQPARSPSFNTNSRQRHPIDEEFERDLVRLTEPTVAAVKHSINITHNGSDKQRQTDKDRLEKEELQYHDEDADYIYEETPSKSIKENKVISDDSKDKLEDESKYYSSPKNNVESSKNKHDDTEIDDDEETEAVVPKINEKTVILTDNFYLPGGKNDEPVEEYYYEYEYEDETEEPGPVTASTARSVTTQKPVTTTKKVSKALDDVPATQVTVREDKTEEVDTKKNQTSSEEGENPNTTESWVVVASVQTSRSVSGAIFLPLGVKQEEKKAPLTELEALAKLNEEQEEKRKQSQEEIQTSIEESLQTTSTSVSTESINDKLDSIQSELSSGVLSGKFPVLKEMTTQEPQIITTKPPPVFIRKFSPKARPDQQPKTASTTTTTEAPTTTEAQKAETKKIIIEDDISGLLPADFKPRYQGYKKKGGSTTTTTTTTTTTETPAVNRINNTRSFKNSPAEQSIKFEEENIAKFLPKDFKLNKPELKVAVTDDIDKFLPPGYKKQLNAPVVPVKEDISKFLPKGYNPPKQPESTTKKIVNTPVDISKLLPPGYNLQETEQEESLNLKPLPEKNEDDLFSKLLQKSHSALDALLPPGFKPTEEEIEEVTTPSTTTTTTTTASPGGFVFPKRPGGNKTPSEGVDKRPKGPPPPKIEIKKGPPKRLTTEFTGWPTVATTPISIEKLLQQSGGEKIDLASLFNKALGNVNGNSAVDSAPAPPDSPFSLPTTTTTTTSTTTVKPTEPGYCQNECNLAGTIRIVDGVKWRPELLDHNTEEWKNLAKEVKQELNEVFIKSDKLRRWYKTLRIDSFSQGSVLVDYFVELDDISDEVSTLQIKRFFHDALMPTHLPESMQNETSDERQSNAVPQVKETFMLGKFVLDPVSTDFIFVASGPEISEDLLPQWAIAVMVMSFFSLLFVILFGVAVLVNRQKAAKKKGPVPLTAAMLNELNKNHMGGIDNYGNEELYNVDDGWGDEKEPPYVSSSKRGVWADEKEPPYSKHEFKSKRLNGGSIYGSSATNIYDSWGSARNPPRGADYYDDSGYDPYSHRSTYSRDYMMHEPPYPYHKHEKYDYRSSRRNYRDYDPNF